MAIDDNYIYLAGQDCSPGTAEWRMEKRRKDTGALVSGFGDTDTGVIQEDFTTGYEEIASMVIDDNYIYVAGWDNLPENTQWRIEKRSKDTGDLVDGFGDTVTHVIQYNPSNGQDCIHSITVDENYIYSAGEDYSNSNPQWRIDKRSKDTGALITGFGTAGVIQYDPSGNPDSIYSICADANYIYAVTSTAYVYGLVKYSKTDGSVVTSFGTNGYITLEPYYYNTLTKISIIDNSIHVLGHGQSEDSTIFTGFDLIIDPATGLPRTGSLKVNE